MYKYIYTQIRANAHIQQSHSGKGAVNVRLLKGNKHGSGDVNSHLHSLGWARFCPMVGNKSWVGGREAFR